MSQTIVDDFLDPWIVTKGVRGGENFQDVL